MAYFAYVENNQVVEVHDFLPQAWRNVSALNLLIDDELLKSLGWEPKIKFSERIKQVVEWTLANDRWLHK